MQVFNKAPFIASLRLFEYIFHLMARHSNAVCTLSAHGANMVHRNTVVPCKLFYVQRTSCGIAHSYTCNLAPAHHSPI